MFGRAECVSWDMAVYMMSSFKALNLMSQMNVLTNYNMYMQLNLYVNVLLEWYLSMVFVCLW